MNYKLGVYGDSIAFGYGNNNQSWFDYLSDGTTSLKLAQNGEKITDVLNKIKTDNNHYSNLILAVGINDLLQSSPISDDLSISTLINQYTEILKAASFIADTIIIQSVLPVREELFPAQAWLDEKKWVLNKHIVQFNKALNTLCEHYKLTYIDAYSKFLQRPLKDIYTDAVHLNNHGQKNLYEIYTNFITSTFKM